MEFRGGGGDREKGGVERVVLERGLDWRGRGI